VELRFVPPVLAHLDELDIEVLACTVWSDARPVHGVAGLCDWRMGGRISDRLLRGDITGERGEVSLLPGRPRLAFDKLLLFGAGPRESFDEDAYGEVVEKMLAVLADLASRAAVVQLPGRHEGLLPPDRAADILLARAGREREHDVWTLVEDGAARQLIMQHMIEERRRIRRAF
jgi:hypothetical protein